MNRQDFRQACVTGGAGFIGSHLSRALLAQGLEVTVVDDLSVGRREAVPEGADFVEGSILEPAVLARATRGCDIVFHLAARVAIRSSFEFVQEDALTNAAGTAAVMRAAVLAPDVRKVVSTSSMAVYADSPGPEPISESHPTQPVSPYGVCKFTAEQLTHMVCANAGMDSVVLRLFNTYGPGQTLSPYVGVVTIFVNALLRGERPRIFGDGEQARDFVHVDDVVQAFLLAMQASQSGRTFNIGSGVAVTVNEVFRVLAGIVAPDIDPEHVEQPDGELRYSIADIALAKKMLGYEPRRVFATDIEEVVGEIVRLRAVGGETPAAS